MVRRVGGLDRKYEHDIALLEDNYVNLRELDERVNELGVLYSYDGGNVKRAHDLLQREVEKGRIHTVRKLPGNELVMPLADDFSKE